MGTRSGARKQNSEADFFGAKVRSTHRLEHKVQAASTEPVARGLCNKTLSLMIGSIMHVAWVWAGMA